MTEEPQGAALSRGTQALWGMAAPGRRGPKPAMTVRSIAAAGIAVADADGIDAVTMAAVAGRLGYSTMALYRHVESREDLLVVMADEALGPAPDFGRRRTWRGRITEWAVAEAGRLLAHPWYLDVRTGSPPLGPQHLAWMDAGMGILQQAGLSPQRAASGLLLVDGYVRSTIGFAAPVRRLARGRRLGRPPAPGRDPRVAAGRQRRARGRHLRGRARGRVPGLGVHVRPRRAAGRDRGPALTSVWSRRLR